MKKTITFISRRAAGMLRHAQPTSPSAHKGRTLITLLIMLLTTATSWAETVNVGYKDADGTTKYVDATVLNNTMNDLAAGWYVVNSDVTYSGNLYTNGDGDVNIILCDGATLTASNITPSGYEDRLRIYGQSQGTGTANISGTLAGNYNLTIYGGTINANILDCYEGSVGINGGTVNVGRISPYGGVWLGGGNVTVTGEVEARNYGNIYLSGGTVKASSYSASGGYVYISKGLTYYDGTGASYTGTEGHDAGFLNLISTEIAAIAGKTLRPYDYRGGTCGDYENENNVTWAVCDTDGNSSYETLIISGTGAMKNYGSSNQPWAAFKSDITTVVIGDGVTRIGGNAFCQFTALTSVTIAPSVTTIGNAVFFECTNLTTVSGASGVTYVDSSAFYGTAWENNLPNGLNYVGHVAYRFVGDGTSVNLYAATTQMIYEACFQDSKITSIVIPASVERIGDQAFAHSALQKIYVLRHESSYPEITQLGNDAFEGCFNLTIVVPAAAYDNYNGLWFSGQGSSILKRGYTVTCGAGVTATTYAPIVAEGETVTLGYTGTDVPAGYRPTYSYNDGTDDHAISGTTFTMPDEDVTVSSALRSTHESVPVAYVDADGTLYDGDNAAQAVALDGSETSLAAGTYFVGLENVNFDHTITLTGNVTLILKDGCEMKVGTSDAKINGNGIKRDGDTDLTIYGQTAQTGTLSVYVSGDYWNAISPRNLTINGGNVIANAEGKGANGLKANGGGTITINRGNVNATATGSSAIGIQSTNAVTINGGTVSATGGTNGIRIDAGAVTINGGTVSATGGSGSGINCNGKTITLGWTNATDRVYISSFYNISSVTVGGAGGKCFADADGNYYGGTYTDNFSALAGKELQPATAYTLTLGSGITTTTEPLFTYSDVDYYAGTVTLGITPPAGYLFGAYTVNGTAIDGNTFTITANATVDATFTVLPWDGDGSEGSPYIIYNKDQLDLLAHRVNGTHGETRQEDGYSGKYFKLNNNISYTHTSAWNAFDSDESNYEAIGGYYDDDGRNFCGHFDGNNKTISGIRIYKDGNDNADMCQGIFSHTGDGAVIHDLTLADACITGYHCIGGIVGYNEGGTVARCHVAGDVAVCAVRSFAYYHGGIVGDNYSGTIEQCTSAATLTTADADNSYWYGGIAGSNSGTLRDNLAIGATVPAAAYNSYGAITGENDGGIAGDNYGTLQRNYYAACKVADTENATGVGCGYIGDGNGGRIVADVTANNGAVPGYFLTLGEGITIAGGATTFTIPAHGETAEVTYHVAAAGANVTLSYSGTIGDGYQLGIVSNDGTADHALSPDGNGNYTITMPAANVTVTATVTVLPWTGDGSESSPYIIYNKDQLDLLAHRVNGTHGETLQEDGYQDTYFKLNNDISYTHTSAWNDYTSDESNFEAIGGYYGADRSFFGHFDGNSKTISGIRIYKGGSSNADNFQGIFGRTASIADIHDLTLADARITGNVFTGGIVGNNTVATVARCHVADDVAVCAVQSHAYYHGGIVGDNHGTIEQCTSAATLTTADAANSKYYGGIAGSNWSTLCDNLAIGATVPAAKDNTYGAITGENNGSLQRNYYAACKVANTENATGVGCGSIGNDDDGYTTADVNNDNNPDGAVCINTLALAANQAPDQNYWTTYYNSALGFTIDADENACAYTAEYEGGNALTLHKLGKVIPKGTAVIIVGADNSIGMTASDETVTVPTNNLDGVDVRTEKSTLGSGTFYVLSKQNDKFGFFQYNAQYMPARKAYLLIADSSAPSLTMVFDNETTEIKTTDFTDYTDKADTWYSLDGRKLDKQPTAKGIYIHNGRKEVVR